MDENVIAFLAIYGLTIAAVFIFFGIIKLLKFTLTNFWVSRAFSILLMGFYIVVNVPAIRQAIIKSNGEDGWLNFFFLLFIAYLSILFFVVPVVFDTWESDDIEWTV